MIKECLACEKSFDPIDSAEHGTSERFVNQYCSKVCEDHFEQYLQENALSAEDSAAHIPSHAGGIGTNSASSNDINKLIAHFSTRIKEKE